MDYFAGANTRKGFESIFEESFKDCEKLYILKGSSGCGKSTLMRKVADKAKKHGLKCDYIYCSADSGSLDGVIIPELKTAIADGTAPHVLEPKYPGVRETIINLGEFWDEAKIMPHKTEIISLTDSKKEFYTNAYNCLSALGGVSDIKRSIINKCIIRDKISEYVIKLTDKVIAKEQKGSIKNIFVSSFSSDGIKTLPTFGKVRHLYRIVGKGSEQILSSFKNLIHEYGISAVCAYSPTDVLNTEAVFFSKSRLLVTSLQSPPCESFEHEINVSTTRFFNNDALVSCRNRLKGIDKLLTELAVEAQKELKFAKEAHNAIEKIYIPAMNFKKLDEYTRRLGISIFGE